MTAAPAGARGCLGRLGRLVWFVLPQVVCVTLGAGLGLVLGVVDGLGGWAGAVSRLSGPSGGPGPGHAGAGLLVILAVIVTVFALALAASVTLAGLKAAVMGGLFGFVASFLFDFLRLLRVRVDSASPWLVKKWAGAGAALTFAFCAWIALFNPLGDVLGVFAVTGSILVVIGAALGLARCLWARLASRQDRAVTPGGET